MLENMQKTKSEDKAELNQDIKSLRARLVGLQQQLRAGKLPVLVLIEGCHQCEGDAINFFEGINLVIPKGDA